MGTLLAIGASVVSLTGAILLLIPEPSSFGWFAYTPLSATSFVPTPWIFSPRYCLGAVLLIVGISALLFTLGWWAGRQRRSRVTRRLRNQLMRNQ